MTHYPEMKALYERFRSMDGGGPRLTIIRHDIGYAVFDGTHCHGKYYRKQEASKDLRAVGFISHKLGTTVYFHTY